MGKKLDIDCYLDGYKSSELNCIDLPIAAACGFFGRENYFYYCALYCIYMNFFLDFQKNWLENRNIFLKVLGLELVSHEVNELNLVSSITKNIDEDAPVLLIVKYGSLFYSKYYGWGTFNHGLIVSDYNDTYDLIGIRDREVIRDYINQGVFTSDVMHRITLQSSQLREIWLKSNIKFGEEQLTHFNKIYSLHKQNNKFMDFSHSLANEFERMDRKSMLLLYIQNYIQKDDQFLEPDIEAMRRVFYRSFLTLFGCIEKYISIDENFKSDYISVRDKFMRHRLLTLNHIQLSMVTNRGKNDLIKWLAEDVEYSNALIEFLQAILGSVK